MSTPLGAILLLMLTCLAHAERLRWDPARTWVFAVGILRFEGAKENDWPEEGRVDEVMLQALRQRGVPKEQIVFLKNDQARLATIQERFAAFVRKPAADDLLIFYYAGHGSRDYDDPARPVHLVPYDGKNPWQVADVVRTIETGFKGTKVLLTADCCHSGAMAEEAARQKGRISYGVLTSARSSATSTGSWTFTQCLAELYAGKALLDMDRDGQITLADAAEYCDLQMAFKEDQRATHATTGALQADLIFAETKAGPGRAVVMEGEGRSDGDWYAAQVLAAKAGRFFVTWPGWDHSEDCWLTAENLKPKDRKLPPVGAAVEIEWGKEWYPGKVMRSELGLLLVAYDGYPESDWEWVPPDRLRPKKKK